MKNFLVFIGDIYYPLGGMKDFYNDYDDFDSVKIAIKNKLEKEIDSYKQYVWAYIYDVIKNEIVWGFDDEKEI